MSWGNTVANQILSLYVKGTLPAAPAGCFLHLYTTAPPLLDGTGGAALPGDGWWVPPDVRAAMASPVDRATTNQALIALGTPLVARGPIRFWAFRATVAAGSTLILRGEVAPPLSTIVDRPLQVAAGALSIALPRGPPVVEPDPVPEPGEDFAWGTAAGGPSFSWLTTAGGAGQPFVWSADAP